MSCCAKSRCPRLPCNILGGYQTRHSFIITLGLVPVCSLIKGARANAKARPYRNLSGTQVTFVNEITFKRRIIVVSQFYHKAVAREVQVVRGTIRRPRFSRTRISTMSHVPYVLGPVLLPDSTALVFESSVLARKLAAVVAGGIPVDYDELM